MVMTSIIKHAMHIPAYAHAKWGTNVHSPIKHRNTSPPTKVATLIRSK